MRIFTTLATTQHDSEFKGWVDFAMLFTLWSSLSASTQQAGKAGGLQILCCQGIKVTDYNFNLDALALKPSNFCNVRVNY
jgi:hypothetical protein